MNRGLPVLSTGLAIGLTLFQIWSVIFSTMDPLLHRALFLSWVMTLAFLSSAIRKPGKKDLILAVLSALFGLYYLGVFDRIQWRWPMVDSLTGFDLVVGALLVFLVAELTRRYVGWPIVLVATAFSLFLLAGHWVPGPLSHRYFSIGEFLDQMVYTINGIFGSPLAVASTYVYFFILFGILLYHSGGGDFFIELSRVVAARTRGGSAKVAVVSCGLFGMISGSPTSDAVTTGTFTIPLMKRSGYRATDAGAVVAAAATGGSIMPPVMGSAVFIMAEFTGIPYVEIVIAAAVPALLYYFSLLAQVHFHALRHKVEPLEAASEAGLLRRQLYFLIPLVILVGSLLRGDIPTHAAALASAVTIAVSWLRRETRMDWRKLVTALEEAARAAVVVVAATASAGIVVAAIAFSGIGGKFTGLLLGLAGPSLFLVLVLTMLVCIILGMGMPVPSAYVLTAVLIAPALVGMGLPLLSTHLFMIYFAIVSAITPPVAVAAYAVAGLSGGNPNQIGVKAVRLAALGFVIPFLFIYRPELVLVGTVGEILLAVATAFLGVLALAAGLEGWLRRALGLWQRMALVASGLMLLIPGIYSDLAGGLLFLGLYLFARRHA